MGYKSLVTDTGRECTVCGTFYKWENYYKWKRSKNGYRSSCIKCSKEINSKRSLTMLRYYNYGLTQEKYDKLFEHQGGECGICHKDLISRSKITVDHDHNTGQIRGLLCAGCNTGLGQFKDSVSGLQSAIHYLNNQPYSIMER